MMQISGKNIWVIGASAGIGEALSRELARRGARLALSARNAEALERLNTETGQQGHIVLPLDVTDRAALEAAKNQLVDQWGAIDMMVFVAGTYWPMRAYEMDEDKARQTFAVNFVGAFNATAAIIPPMLAKGAGRIVLFSSVAGFRGLPNGLAYGASKAALTHLAEVMKLDLEDKGIGVQVVHPGFVRTRLTDKNEFQMPFRIEPEEAARRVADGIESGRFEIHFPKRFTLFMKLLRILPYPLYFRMTRLLLGV